MIALGTAYGQPDIILIPEHPLNVPVLMERVWELYDLQKNVVIVCGEGVVDETGQQLGARHHAPTPRGTSSCRRLRGATAAAGREDRRRLLPAAPAGRIRQGAIFTRKVGHTQRGRAAHPVRPLLRGQLGGKAVDMLLEGHNNSVAILQWSMRAASTSTPSTPTRFRDRWGFIHARQMHPSLYDPETMQPSRIGVDYLLPIFTNAIGQDDMESVRTRSSTRGT